jgi:hypothetical protein
MYIYIYFVYIKNIYLYIYIYLNKINSKFELIFLWQLLLIV